jgi:hypothetical protein
VAQFCIDACNEDEKPDDVDECTERGTNERVTGDCRAAGRLPGEREGCTATSTNHRSDSEHRATRCEYERDGQNKRKKSHDQLRSNGRANRVRPRTETCSRFGGSRSRAGGAPRRRSDSDVRVPYDKTGHHMATGKCRDAAISTIVNVVDPEHRDVAAAPRVPSIQSARCSKLN